MRRKMLLIVLVLLLGAVICGPLFERIDHWDHFPQHHDDIVLTVTILAVCAGIWVLSKPLDGARLRRSSERLVTLLRKIIEAPTYLITSADQSPPGSSSVALRI